MWYVASASAAAWRADEEARGPRGRVKVVGAESWKVGRWIEATLQRQRRSGWGPKKEWH
jgi:hypothetical protein